MMWSSVWIEHSWRWG